MGGGQRRAEAPPAGGQACSYTGWRLGGLGYVPEEGGPAGLENAALSQEGDGGGHGVLRCLLVDLEDAGDVGGQAAGDV